MTIFAQTDTKSERYGNDSKCNIRTGERRRRQEKNSQLQQQASQLQEQSARIAKSIPKMHSRGVSIDEIAEDFEVDIEFVKDVLKAE